MPITNQDRRKIERVQEAYEEWRRTRAPGAMTPRPWPELTIAEAEIAAGMFGMGVRAASQWIWDVTASEPADGLRGAMQDIAREIEEDLL